MRPQELPASMVQSTQGNVSLSGSRPRGNGILISSRRLESHCKTLHRRHSHTPVDSSTAGVFVRRTGRYRRSPARLRAGVAKRDPGLTSRVTPDASTSKSGAGLRRIERPHRSRNPIGKRKSDGRLSAALMLPRGGPASRFAINACLFPWFQRPASVPGLSSSAATPNSARSPSLRERSTQRDRSDATERSTANPEAHALALAEPCSAQRL